MNATKKIALASACGAAVGYSLGTTFLSGAWLILAALIGGACGWISFDPRGFGRAFSQSLRETSREASSKLQELWAEPWRKILPRAIRSAIDPLLMFQALGTVMVVIMLPLTKHESLLPICVISYGMTIGIGLLLFVVFFTEQIGNKDARRKVLDQKQVNVFTGNVSALKFLALTNPIVLPFTVSWILIVALYHSGRGLIWIIRRIPLVIRFCWIVTVKTCVLAHDNGRLASFAGASVGALIGVMAGHLFVAMVVGAVVGMLAHYVGAFFPKTYTEVLVQNLKTERVRLRL